MSTYVSNSVVNGHQLRKNAVTLRTIVSLLGVCLQLASVSTAASVGLFVLFHGARMESKP